jgi:hypothetical protein
MGTSTTSIQGLPQELQNDLFWVGQKYRTNELSLSPGGTNVIVYYQSGDVLGYDRIKYPSRYIDVILSRRVFNDGVKLSEIPSEQAADLIVGEVAAIYALKYEDVENGSHDYKEVWNCDSDQMPWDGLDDYQSTSYDENYEFSDYTDHNYEEDTFYALTDGQYGDYDDFNGDIGQLMDNLGF